MLDLHSVPFTERADRSAECPWWLDRPPSPTRGHTDFVKWVDPGLVAGDLAQVSHVAPVLSMLRVWCPSSWWAGVRGSTTKGLLCT